MKRISTLGALVVVLAVLLLGALSGCGGGGATLPAQDAKTLPTTATTPPSGVTEPTPPKSYAVGQTFNDGHWQVTIERVFVRTTDLPNTVREPNEQYVALELTIKNLQRTPAGLVGNGTGITLYGSDGAVYTSTVDLEQHYTAEVELPAGGMIHVTSYYPVPTSLHQAIADINQMNADGSTTYIRWELRW